MSSSFVCNIFTEKMNCIVLPLLLFHYNYHSNSVLTQNSLPEKQQTRHDCCPKGMYVCENSLCQDFTFINVEPYLAALVLLFMDQSTAQHEQMSRDCLYKDQRYT